MKYVTGLFTVLIGLTCVSAADIQNGNFDGERFHNQAPFQDHGLLGLLQWKLFSRGVEWPDWVESEPQKVPEHRVTGNRLSITFINHSTVLIQYQGINILTDPIWSRLASPFAILGPTRVRSPGVRMEDLPPIDLILISHNHYDHLDLETLRSVSERFAPTVLVGLLNTAVLQEAGLETIHELDWWEAFRYKELQIVFTPTQHFSARGVSDRMKSLWGGFVIASPAGNVYFAGDTGVGPHNEQLQERFKEFRLALLPIGGYEPRWFMKDTHMTPAEAVEAHKILNAKMSIGIHFGTFANLSDEAMDQPLKDLEVALKTAEVNSARFITLGFGETKSDL